MNQVVYQIFKNKIFKHSLFKSVHDGDWAVAAVDNDMVVIELKVGEVDVGSVRKSR